jgi:hypothetical protein
MKTNKIPATSKLLKRFDNELKNLLNNDLNQFMANNLFLMAKRASAGQQILAVA